MILSLALLGMQSMNRLLYGFIERDSAHEFNCPYEAAVVLGGGYLRGSDPSGDRLSGESEARVMKGIEVFQECDAGWLVLSGRSKWGKDAREGELMREEALRAGIPEERILIEAKSRNTREHPGYIEAMKPIDRDSRLAIVTSPWHVRRAIREFKHIFPAAVAIAAYQSSYSPDYSTTVLDWIPSALALERSTRPFQEYVGMAWYSLLDLFSGGFKADEGDSK